MEVEGGRASDGKLTSIGAGSLNPEGTNQWSPSARAKRRLDAAVLRHLKPKCADSFGKRVAEAIENPADEKNLKLLQYALPASSKLDVGLSGPDGGPVEIASRTAWESVATTFSGRFAGDTELAIEQPDTSSDEGAD